jgi:Bacterial EndoU nuclease
MCRDPENRMALDRYDDGVDGSNDVKPEQHRRPGGSVGDALAARAEPAELRTRAECYEALRAADGRAVPDRDNHGVPEGTRPDRSGWDTVDPGKRPPLDALRVTPERSAHILDGDATGGGHRHGTGRPGKTEFPANWDDEKITDALLDVARRPDQQPGHQKWNDRWVARGTRDDVEIVVVISGDGRIWSGWPNPGGPGVIKNPEES